MEEENLLWKYDEGDEEEEVKKESVGGLKVRRKEKLNGGADDEVKEETNGVYYDDEQVAGIAVSDKVACPEHKENGGNALVDVADDDLSFSAHEKTNGQKDTCTEEIHTEKDLTENGLNSDHRSEIEEHENITRERSDQLKVEEFDLERVLDEQETHDLYCPNCNSCITRRVILRKRKRIGKESSSDASIKKLHEEPPRTAGLDSTAATPEQLTREDEQEPDIFKCLSCFSFFIPTEDGFNIFRIFGKKRAVPVQSSEQKPEGKVNWMSIFKIDSSRKKEGESGSGIMTETISVSGPNTEEDPHREVQSVSAIVTQEGILSLFATNREHVIGQSLENKDDTLKGQVIIEEKQKTSRDDGILSLLTTNREHIIGQSLEKKDDTLKGQVTLDEKEKTSRDYGILSLLATNREHIIGQSLENNGDTLKGQVTLDQKGKTSTDYGILSLLATNREHIIDQFTENKGATPNLAENPTPDIYIDINQPSNLVPTQVTDWDVLKAVVYGGLMESIASLGVVSSAAGANASTLNIVVLGLANLIAGLLIIIHDLFDLKAECDVRNDERVDRYHELLGLRRNFRRHIIVAIISYLLVGLLPPAVYGFTWWKSDNKEYKLLAVAASSLLCISLLAIAKAHVKPQKAYLQVLFYYLSLGVSASGLAYVVGILINKLLEKLGLFFDHNTDSTPNLMYYGISGKAPAWTS